RLRADHCQPGRDRGNNGGGIPGGDRWELGVLRRLAGADQLFVPKLSSSASLTATYVVDRDSTVVGQVFGGTVNTTLQGAEFEIFDTPTAGAHTYAVKAFVST